MRAEEKGWQDGRAKAEVSFLTRATQLFVADDVLHCRRLAACTRSSATCRLRRSIGTTSPFTSVEMLRKFTCVVPFRRGERELILPLRFQDGIEPRLQRMLSALGSGGGTLAKRVGRLNAELVSRN